MNEATTNPLNGVRVLELGSYIAAPTAGRLLADFGAEVIKVERPVTGDELRNWRLYSGTTSMFFRTLNRNKKSITIDLGSEDGRELILQLIPHFDVVLENFRPGKLEAWGLGPDELNTVNSNLIITRISAYGQTGPLAKSPGFGAVAEAVGGLRELVGEPDRPPSRVGISIGDTVAGLYAAFGTMMALYQREIAKSTSSMPDLPLAERVLDVALNESVLSVMESLIPDYLAYGVTRTRTGGRMEGVAPSNAYACQGGDSIVIAANGDSIFGRLTEAMERPDLLTDETLHTNQGRWERREDLDGFIGAWTASLPRSEVIHRLSEAGVPAGPIYTAADICQDEQLQARHMIQYFDVDTGESHPRRVGFPGIVPVFGGFSRPVQSVGPELGEHTIQVLGDLLGRTAEEMTMPTHQHDEP